MADQEFLARFQTKRDSQANWESNNPTLLDGEIATVRTSKGTKLKIGDGERTFSDLEYTVATPDDHTHGWEDIGISPTGGNKLTWDGDPNGQVGIDVGLGDLLYRVSDAVLTVDDFSNGFVLGCNNSEPMNLTSASIIDEGSGVIIDESFYFLSASEGAVYLDVPIPAGTYFTAVLEDDAFTNLLIIPEYTGFPSVVKIPEEYLPETTEAPTKVSELENDLGYLTSYTETDPTVPAWAKAETKPTYEWSELGEKSDGEIIPIPEKYLPEIPHIIDVTSLPTENINESAWYRVVTATFITNRQTAEEQSANWTCYCVETLPETGEVCTDLTMSFTLVYYNLADNNAYGYIDSDLGEVFGVSAGWYPVSTLCEIASAPWGGIITDISEDPCDDSIHILIGYDFYIYKNEWMKVPFAYEKAPKFDIQWDGDVGDRFALDMTTLGYENTYFVKVSDLVISQHEAIDCEMIEQISEGSVWSHVIVEDNIDTITYPGAITVCNEIVSVYSEDDLNTALGLPTGYVTNGTYFVYIPDSVYVSRFTAPARITKIDEKYLPDMSVDINSLGLHSVATTGNYNSLNNRPTIYTDVIRYTTTQSLSSTYKSNVRTSIDVYSKSEVDTKIANSSSSVDLSAYSTTTEVETMISEAISGAIGGSY